MAHVVDLIYSLHLETGIAYHSLRTYYCNLAQTDDDNWSYMMLNTQVGRVTGSVIPATLD